MDSDGSFPSLDMALDECRRWIEAVTGRQFAHRDLRQSLEDGVLLCELISRIKPGAIRRINGLSTTYAYLDNLKSFLQACEEVGLKGSQLFSITDLQKMSPSSYPKRARGGQGDRRMRSVAVTIYWLGKAASNMPSYAGPELNMEAFSGLVGTKETHSLFDSKDGVRSGSLGGGNSRNDERPRNERNRQGGGSEPQKDNDVTFRDLTVRITKIRRQESGFGLSLSGGSDEGCQPYIDGIKPGSSASLSNLQVGDEILWVNGQSVTGATRQKLLTHIGKGDIMGSLSLKIRRYSRRRPQISSISSDEKPPQIEEIQPLQSAGRETQSVELSEDMWVDEEGSPLPPPADDETVEQLVLEEEGQQVWERETNGFIPSHEDSELVVAVDASLDLPEPPDAPSPDLPPPDDFLLHDDHEIQPTEETQVQPQQQDVDHSFLTPQNARKKWLESDWETMESVRSASLPRSVKKHFLQTSDTESMRRARSVEREKEEVEFLKRRRSEQSARITGRPTSQEVHSSKPSLQEQIRAELRRSPLAPRRGVDQPPNKPQEVVSAIESIVNPKHQEVPLSEVVLRKKGELTVPMDEKVRLSQQMQEEAEAEFRKTLEEQEKMRQLEREADELIALAEAELLLADQELENGKMSDGYAHEIIKKETEFPVEATLSSGSGSSTIHSPVIRMTDSSVSPFRETVSMRQVNNVSSHAGSRYSLSAWSDSNVSYEDDDTGLQGLDSAEKERILENELQKLHNLELEWAQEHREERRRKETGDGSGLELRELERLEEERKQWEKEKEKDRTLEKKRKQKLDDEKRKLDAEKAALEEERKRQVMEQERQMKELELEKKRLEEEKKRHIEMELQSRMQLEEEKRKIEMDRQRYSEEKDKRRRDVQQEARLRQEEEIRLRQQVDTEKRRRREEDDSRRMALEEERERLMEEDRVRQMEMQEEMRKLQQVEAERKRRQEEEMRIRRQQEEEEEKQNESYADDMAFIRRVAEQEKERKEADVQRDGIEERVRRVKEDIALTVQREDERRKEKSRYKEERERTRERNSGERHRQEQSRERDGGETHRRHQKYRRSKEVRPLSQTNSETFVAQTVFHDDSGVYTTEL